MTHSDLSCRPPGGFVPWDIGAGHSRMIMQSQSGNGSSVGPTVSKTTPMTSCSALAHTRYRTRRVPGGVKRRLLKRGCGLVYLCRVPGAHRSSPPSLIGVVRPAAAARPVDAGESSRSLSAGTSVAVCDPNPQAAKLGYHTRRTMETSMALLSTGRLF